MSSGPVEPDGPRARLISYLESVPFPWSDDTDVERTAKRLAGDKEALSQAGPKITVHILSSFLTDYLVNHLILMFARRGLAAEIRSGDYGVLATAILDESHQIHADPPDLFLILPSFRDLAYAPPVGASAEMAGQAIEQEAAFWQSLLSRLPAPAVQLSFDTPSLRPLGELDGFTPGGTAFHARQVNMALAAGLPASCTLVDAEALAQTVGRHNWHDPHVYNLSKQPFSFAALPFVADVLSAAAIGFLGKARKVLVLDLDDTLWGGVIGDDGIENLELGPESPEGEAFTAFQLYLAQLRNRGVILAVCSKNNDGIARQPFRSHPAMVLKETDIACFVANFEDKPTNLRRIAEALNVGLDALVFVDDNPVERALMRQELPQVLTIEMPDNPARYASALEAARAFPLSRLTDDDLHRADSYAARAATVEAMAGATDMDGFLAGLEARAITEAPGPGNLDRIALLLAKTNQFKLNPTVFTVPDLATRRGDIIALRLVDRLQDYGIVAVAVLSDADGVLTIENWVMSCRVFSRRLEFVMFELIVAHAQRSHTAAIDLTYTPSDRNGLISDLLPTLGFVARGKDDKWSAPVKADHKEGLYLSHHMEIVHPS